MFPFGALLALLGYSGTYVGVCRLAGDQRTVMSIVKGDNGGKMIKGSDSGGGIFDPNDPNKIKLPGDSLGLGNSRSATIDPQTGLPTLKVNDGPSGWDLLNPTKWKFHF